MLRYKTMYPFFHWSKIWPGVLVILLLLSLVNLIYLDIEVTASRRQLTLINQQLEVLSSGSFDSPNSFKESNLPDSSFEACFNLEEASQHVGEEACIEAKLDHLYISQTGTIFLNFCPNYQECSFQGVIFASQAEKFNDLENYEGEVIQLSGLIKTYQGKAEIIIDDPNQIKVK